ncbi:uncharacterized protein LOC116145501 [Pistacia vera]|uniref:uncharacterized protein LOC116145501 n=1 Tax=Pistacia vera TaxID=55513 RepID=UPI00126365BC|nr:uncharacterized protein LOC116145501 [Pistacia vera]
MESNRKRRGFIKGKLMPLYRVGRSSSNVQYSSKVMKPSQPSAATASVGYVVHHHQDYVVAQPQPQPKVSFIVQADNNREVNHFDNLFGDEMVDDKAASYISSVQERFKLERSNSAKTVSV